MIPPRSGPWIVASAVWSFAEATVFFIVPDVILSAVAVQFGLRTGMVAAAVASVAAALGGLALYLVTARGLVDLFVLFDQLPAITAAMIDRARSEQQAADWPLAMLEGSFSGIPYKLYAASAAQAGVPLLPFLLWSIPARLVRFVFVVGAAAIFRPLFLSWLGPRHALLPVIGLWIAFYAVFWWRMPG